MLAFQNAVASAAMIFENIGRRARRRTGQAEQLLKTRDTKSLGPKSYLLTPSPSPGSMLRRRDLQIPWSEGLLTYPLPLGSESQEKEFGDPLVCTGLLTNPSPPTHHWEPATGNCFSRATGKPGYYPLQGAVFVQAADHAVGGLLSGAESAFAGEAVEVVAAEI